MKDLGNVFFVLGIQIHLDCSLGIFSLSQKAHADKVLDIFNMKNSVPRDSLIAKSNKFKLTSMPKKGNWTKSNAKHSLCVCSKESHVCSSLYTSRYCVYSWNAW